MMRAAFAFTTQTRGRLSQCVVKTGTAHDICLPVCLLDVLKAAIKNVKVCWIRLIVEK